MSRRELIVILGLGILILVVYLPSFPGEFHFDDFSLMLENPEVAAPHFSYGLFLQEYGGRPLTLWAFHWNHRLFGPNPWTYHAFSLILHFIAASLLFLWVRREADDVKWAFLAAAVFALHPLQTQPVNYIWSRSVLMMFCFGMASLLLVRRHAWLSLVCFQLAIWSRTDAVVFLIPLIVSHRRFWKAPVLLAVLNLGAFTYFMSQYRPAEIGWTHPHVLSYWLSQTVAFWKYLGMMVLPLGLSIDHDFAVRVPWQPVIAVIGLLVLAYVLWRNRSRYRLEVQAACWVALALAPAALLPNSDPFNESRAYPALAGFAVIAGSVLVRGFKRLPTISTVGAVVLLLALIPATASRNNLWRSDLSVWQDAAQKNPHKARVLYNLAAAWARNGNVVQAERSFGAALALDPSDDLAHAGLGYCAEVQGNWALSVERYRQAVSLNARNRYAGEGLRRVSRHVEAAREGNGYNRSVEAGSTDSADYADHADHGRLLK